MIEEMEAAGPAETRRDRPQEQGSGRSAVKIHSLRVRRLGCAAVAAATLVAGLIWRMAPLGLSPFFFKYGGSALWAAMVYWIAAAVLPDRPSLRVGAYAALTAALVEATRLFHTPQLDAFRLTLAGRLLLGRFFSLKDVAAYLLAIAICALIDDRKLPGKMPHRAAR